MTRLTAVFEIRLSAPILLRTGRSEDCYEFVIDGHDVGLIFAPESGYRAMSEGDLLWREVCDRVTIRVSHPETEPWPEVPVREDGVRDLTVQSPYFEARISAYRRVAAAAINNLLHFLKYDLRQPFVEFVKPSDDGLHNPTWMDEAQRVAEGGGPHVFVVHLIPGFDRDEFGSLLLEQTDDDRLNAALTLPRKVLLHEEILSDAQAAAFSGNIRRAVLELALSCEVFVKQSFFGTSRAGQVFEHLEDRRQVNVRVIDLLDGVAASVFGESFRAADQTAFVDLDHLFRARNKVAHRGEPIYKDDLGIRHEVTADVLRQWWNSVIRLLTWIDEQSES